VRTRLAIYAERTRPLLEYYRDRGLLRTVAGVGTEAEVFERSRAAVESAGEADKSLV
jgi:adenylate kinase